MVSRRKFRRLFYAVSYLYSMNPDSIPVIDISPLRGAAPYGGVPERIAGACRTHGFFYVAGHGVPEALQQRLQELARDFFALAPEEKMEIAMHKGGRAWRGFFPVGAELTSGKPDRKEGLYFGTELPATDERVAAGLPLHGANLYPLRPPGFREILSEYMDVVTGVGHLVMKGISLSLGLDAEYFHTRYHRDPLILFRMFHYPPQQPPHDGWGVGEHTDYGLLTILLQDAVGGLQVKSRNRWIDAPPLENTFICNIGDMLDRMTGGLYRSTPHRVLNTSGRDRYSFPLFFDPGFDTRIEKIEHIAAADDDREQRWDKASVHLFGGTYGDSLSDKVSRVFPELGRDVL